MKKITFVFLYFFCILGITFGDDLRTDLISHWKLNETNGVRYDSFGNNHLLNTNFVSYAAGKIDIASDFEDTLAQKLYCADNASLSLGTNTSFTLAAWVKQESLGYNTVISKAHGIDTNRRLYSYQLLYLASYGCYAFYIGGGNELAWESVFDANNTIAVGEWHFIVAWYNSTNYTINIQTDNGVINQDVWSGTWDDPYDFCIGGTHDNNNYMDGLIDSVSFWKRVLTPAERMFLYTNSMDSVLTSPPITNPPPVFKYKTTLAWEPATNAAVEGVVNYKLYMGGTSGIYTNVFSAGLSTNYIVTNMSENVPYYFTVRSVSTNGMESDPSNEATIGSTLNFTNLICYPATNLTSTNAMLALKALGTTNLVNAWFRYGTNSTNLTVSVGKDSIPPTNSVANYSVTLTNLTPQTYYFRGYVWMWTNGLAIYSTPVSSFTLSAPPQILPAPTELNVFKVESVKK